MAIDLSQLDSYEIDPNAETVTIGGSVTIGDMMDSLAEAGFMLRKLLTSNICSG